ncbi:MAG TPA: HlyD family efflux transporter periplasmic adaptor subunit [Saprospiraceae bacterium]|nr:HlyD family efflux transporter periplasmic adaptor subunit [Saprospiraceae bacterium]
MKKIIIPILAILIGFGCKKQEKLADAYGNFEADEWLIYPESPGKLLSFSVNEGDLLKKNQLLGSVDTSALVLQREQLNASISAIYAKKQTAGPDISLLQKRKEVILSDRQRVAKLLADSVATQKQMDDINNQLAVLEQQIKVAREKVEIANKSIFAQVNPLRKQIAIVNDRIKKAKIYAPTQGRVTQKFVNAGEVIAPQIPLLKLAKMDTLFLRAYFSGNQYAQLQLNQTVNVHIDPDKTYQGKVTWIAEEAEFTPKIVQTKEERVNLTYAVKIAIPNDGYLKIGMPGEVWLNSSSKENQPKEK